MKAMLTFCQRESMFEKAQLGQINQLHDIGRQLAVLKRLYQSYALIIERVLERQKPVDASIMREHSLSSGQDTQRPTGGQPPATKEFTVANDRSLGVPLSPAAIVRFERLKDRIGLYALSEIQGCLEEKNSMVSLVRPASTPPMPPTNIRPSLSISLPSKNPKQSNVSPV